MSGGELEEGQQKEWTRQHVVWIASALALQQRLLQRRHASLSSGALYQSAHGGPDAAAAHQLTAHSQHSTLPAQRLCSAPLRLPRAHHTIDDNAWKMDMKNNGGGKNMKLVQNTRMHLHHEHVAPLDGLTVTARALWDK